uniref:Uncharacterized protein n=1 Tax=Arundo donax TaxID=35708 RepID=A0A0A9TM69_ARUDO
MPTPAPWWEVGGGELHERIEQADQASSPAAFCEASATGELQRDDEWLYSRAYGNGMPYIGGTVDNSGRDELLCLDINSTC